MHALFLAILLPAAEPPKMVKPIALPVNTKADEDDPHVTSSGLRFYYASNPEDKFDIYLSQRANVRQAWRPGKLSDDCSTLRTKTDDQSVFVTSDTVFPQYIYYASKKDKAKGAKFDLYVATKVLPGPDRVFTESRSVFLDVPKGDEMHPWLTTDGKSLYFSRKTKDGWRVCVARRKEAIGPAGFGEPEEIKDFPADFHHPTLTPDGKTMYLQGPLEKGRWGLFTSTRTAKGWSEPEALEMLNHPDGKIGDKSPSLSRDGRLLYFASDRPEGKGGLDLYVIETAQLAKKK